MKSFAGLALVFLFAAGSHLGLFGQTNDWTFPQARVVVHVIDEEGKPVPGVRTRLGFTGPTNVNDIVPAEGITDTNGVFTGQGFSNGILGGNLEKDRYYPAAPNIPHFLEGQADRWQPWNATYTTVLRKIEKPVAMYARSGWIRIPAISKPCGYDLEASDWVAPYGKGKVSDFIFTLRFAYTNFNQYDVALDLSFTNPLDGIQETQLPKEYAQSRFIWPRQAPTSGYTNAWRVELGAPHKLHPIEDDEAQKFFFRVRTKEKDGKIVSALYGKLAEGFQLAPIDAKTCNVRLTYYLNPTPLDRNLEFDLQKNLLKDLNDEEAPRAP